MIFNRLHPRILVFLNLDYEVNIKEEIYLIRISMVSWYRGVYYTKHDRKFVLRNKDKAKNTQEAP